MRKLPPETCPTLNRIIELIEEVREDNHALRKAALGNAEDAQDAEQALGKVEMYVLQLEAQIEKLEEELEERKAIKLE